MGERVVAATAAGQSCRAVAQRYQTEGSVAARRGGWVDTAARPYAGA